MDDIDLIIQGIGISADASPASIPNTDRVNSLLGKISAIHPVDPSSLTVEETSENEEIQPVSTEEPEENAEETPQESLQENGEEANAEVGETPQEEVSPLSTDAIDATLREYGVDISIDNVNDAATSISVSSDAGVTMHVVPVSHEPIGTIVGDGIIDLLAPSTNAEDSQQEAELIDEEPEEVVEEAEPSEEEIAEENASEDNGTIQENSPTLSVNDSTSRFSGTEWFEEVLTKRVIIAGCGGIGSNLAYQIARLSLSCITLYDDDIVETGNMSGQLFRWDDIGKSKVDAISGMMRNYTHTCNIYAIKQRFTNQSPGEIMMCGFDNMEARKSFFNSWKRYVTALSAEQRKKCLFLDGRLSIDCLQVFCITGDDSANILRYEQEFLFDDSEADETVCSMKQTTYLACMIGSIMVNLFINSVANTLNPVIPYDLPFFTEYDSKNMLFKTES